MIVSLKEFLRTGDLGPVRLGMREDEVFALFGSPNDKGLTSRRRKKPCLWLYGDIELIFDREAWTLRMVNCEFHEPGPPRGGPGIELDPWIIVRRLSPVHFQEECRRERIPLLTLDSVNEGAVEFSVGPGVHLIFAPDVGDSDQPGSIGLCHMTYSTCLAGRIMRNA